jgi:hypothetical protein
MKITSSPNSGSKSNSAKKAPKIRPKPPSQDNSSLQDTFKSAVVEQEQRHLLEEHEVKMQASNELHWAKLQSIREQLQIQLYKIWNEIWLQRQKSLDAGFKEWLKVFMS